MNVSPLLLLLATFFGNVPVACGLLRKVTTGSDTCVVGMILFAVLPAASDLALAFD